MLKGQRNPYLFEKQEKKIAMNHLAAFATLFTLAAAASPQEIYLSSDVATGLAIGAFLVGMLVFAVVMLMDIQASDTIGQKKEQ